MNPTNARTSYRGFTLIEALVALVLASVGLLGVARLQVALSGDGSATTQRLEAQRLLSDKLEEVRQLDAVQLAGFQAGKDTPTSASPTVYSRSWDWVGGSDPGLRMLQISVDWTDRRGQPQSMKSSTMVQPPEGRLAAVMTQPLQAGQTIRGPLDRYIDIPLAAQLIGDGRSSFTIRKAPTNDVVTFVTDDSSGRIIQRCASAPTVTQLLSGPAGCQSYNGVVLAGFVGGANQAVSINLGLLSLPISYTVAYPNRIDVSQMTGYDTGSSTGIECEYRVAYSDPVFILSINGSSTYRYTCVIPLTASSAGWSGYVQLDGDLSVSLVAYVCRYQYPNVAGSDANRRNAQPYRNVNQSLFNQNYMFVIGMPCSGIEEGLLVEHQRCLLLGLVCALNRT